MSENQMIDRGTLHEQIKRKIIVAHRYGPEFYPEQRDVSLTNAEAVEILRLIAERRPITTTAP